MFRKEKQAKVLHERKAGVHLKWDIVLLHKEEVTVIHQKSSQYFTKGIGILLKHEAVVLHEVVVVSVAGETKLRLERIKKLKACFKVIPIHRFFAEQTTESMDANAVMDSLSLYFYL